MIGVESTFVSSPDLEQKTLKITCVLPRIEKRTAKAGVPYFILDLLEAKNKSRNRNF